MTEREAFRAAMQKAAELGRAKGMRQAARIFWALADDSMRVVGTNKIKDTAREIDEIAENIELRALPK